MHRLNAVFAFVAVQQHRGFCSFPPLHETYVNALDLWWYKNNKILVLFQYLLPEKFLQGLREFESAVCCFGSAAVAVKCLALWGPLGCPFFPGCPLWRAHSCIPKCSVCSKTLTSRGRKGLPETAPPAQNAAFVLCPPVEIAEPARPPVYPGRASPGACPSTGERPPAGPPAPLIPPPALPGQQARQAGDALTGSRWSPAEVSGAQQ